MRVAVRVVVVRAVRFAVSGFAVAAVTACGGAGATPTKAAAAEPVAASRPHACIADRVPARLTASAPQDCRDAEFERCHAECQAGDASACTQLAHDLEAGPDGDYDTDADADVDGAARLYARGCHLGDASSCTNYGAYLLHDHAGVGTDPACAARLHALSCEAGDPWGCGMRGMELGRGVGVARDVAAARALLDQSCRAYGGFPCEILADLEAEAEAEPDDAAASGQ